MSTIAVFVVLGGGAYAATALPRNSVGSAQIKRSAVTKSKIARNAVVGSKVKNDSLTGADVVESTLGKVPQAAAADNATHAGSADSATHATSADTAANSGKLGGVAADGFRRTVAQSGETLAGAFSVRYPANATFVVASDSFPVPLPVGTPTPTYHYVAGSSDGTCPGIGQAPAGVLCLYGYNTFNLHFSNISGGAESAPQDRYGWSFDANADTASSGGYIIGSWAYRVP
ncbi:MAG: hypothetical protein JSS99_13980 [Actinobacteria bacterium]|nr:hypothetical protein [Actinomycetota bacterium]